MKKTHHSKVKNTQLSIRSPVMKSDKKELDNHDI